MVQAVIRRSRLYGGLCSIAGRVVVRFVVEKVALDYDFSPSTSVFRPDIIPSVLLLWRIS